MSSSLQQCRLCHRTAPLRKSHVIPEFCFKPVYDTVHRALEINLAANRQRFIQKGFREHLFCDDCEQLFGRLETYFSNEWFQNGKLPNRAESDLIEINGLDFTKFKLFHHSILFRASVSSLAQFKFVSLGKNEELFRKMLLSGDAGTEYNFPFIAQILFHPEDHRVATDIIVEPEISRPNGNYAYIFIFGGCCWMYYASKAQSRSLMPYVFGPTGTLYLVAKCIYDNARIATFANNYRSKLSRDRKNA